MWGADLWNLYGTEGLVKRTPTVTRQQRRRARQQVDMVSQKNRKIFLIRLDGVHFMCVN